MFKRFVVPFCNLFSLIYVASFFCWSSGTLLSSQHQVGAVLQILLIFGLFFWRTIRKAPIYFLPDQMLVCLPYFWSLANAGSAVAWFAAWKISLLVSFAAAMLNFFLLKSAFTGGLRSNTLLQSLLGGILFVVVFVSAMTQYFPSFSGDLFRATLTNLIVAVAGVPVSIAAFYGLVARVEVEES